MNDAELWAKIIREALPIGVRPVPLPNGGVEFMRAYRVQLWRQSEDSIRMMERFGLKLRNGLCAILDISVTASGAVYIDTDPTQNLIFLCQDKARLN